MWIAFCPKAAAHPGAARLAVRSRSAGVRSAQKHLDKIWKLLLESQMAPRLASVVTAAALLTHAAAFVAPPTRRTLAVRAAPLFAKETLQDKIYAWQDQFIAGLTKDDKAKTTPAPAPAPAPKPAPKPAPAPAAKTDADVAAAEKKRLEDVEAAKEKEAQRVADAEAARIADVAKAAEKKAEKAAAPTAPAPAKATAGKGDVTGKYAEPAREAAAIKAKEAEKRPFPVVPLAVGAVAVSSRRRRCRSGRADDRGRRRQGGPGRRGRRGRRQGRRRRRRLRRDEGRGRGPSGAKAGAGAARPSAPASARAGGSCVAAGRARAPPA